MVTCKSFPFNDSDNRHFSPPNYIQQHHHSFPHHGKVGPKRILMLVRLNLAQVLGVGLGNMSLLV
jgi:hypothetical protein